MKLPFLFFLGTAVGLAQTPSAETGDTELQSILAEAKAAWSASRNSGTPRERILAVDARDRQLLERSRAYLATHRAGPEKAELVLALAVRSPRFITSIDVRFDQDGNEAHIVADDATRAAAAAELHAWLAEVHSDRSLEPAKRRGAGRTLARKLIADAKTAAQFDAARQLIEQLAGEGLSEPMVRELQTRLVNAAFALGASNFAAVAEQGAQSRVEVVRQVVAEFQVQLNRQRDEMGMIKFIAADGREVDLSKLRGKVVLIDFWATWCGPCVAELPALKKLHAKYRQNGLEIVGIANEYGPSSPTDTPNQKAAKTAQLRETLLAFVSKNEIPWPHYFDGKFPLSDFAARFGIQLIPATFLIDQEGRLAARNLHGEKLESEIRRLLKL